MGRKKIGEKARVNLCVTVTPEVDRMAIEISEKSYVSKSEIVNMALLEILPRMLEKVNNFKS